MYEIEELRKKIEAQDYIGALQIIDEIDEMSREDKLNKICGFQGSGRICFFSIC